MALNVISAGSPLAYNKATEEFSICRGLTVANEKLCNQVTSISLLSTCMATNQESGRIQFPNEELNCSYRNHRMAEPQ